MTRKNTLRALLYDKRGAAMVEGVIVLPLFVIVLAAVIYFHRAYATKISLGVKARSCAWQYSVNGCTRKSLPEGCPVSEIGAPSDSGTAFGDNFMEAMTNKDKEMATEVDEGRSKLDTVLGGANEVSLMVLQLSEGIVAKPSGSVQKPSILGGGTHSLSANYSVMCNERRRTMGDLLKLAYCSIDSSLPGCPVEG